MIAKAKSVAHGHNVVNYAVTKNMAAQIMEHGISSNDPEIIWQQMKLDFADSAIKNNVIRIELSPAVEESKNYTDDDWRHLAIDFLQKMDTLADKEMKNGRRQGKQQYRRCHSNLCGSQFIVYRHIDSGIPHLHIVVNRFDGDGNVNSDHFIGERATLVANQIAAERGYVQASKKGDEKKQAIRNDCREILASMDKFNWEEYVSRLEAKGYTVTLRKDKEGIVKGYALRKGNRIHKISQIDRNLMASKIERTFRARHAENKDRTRLLHDNEIKQKSKRYTPVPARSQKPANIGRKSDGYGSHDGINYNPDAHKGHDDLDDLPADEKEQIEMRR
jgi:hypothetical protein